MGQDAFGKSGLRNRMKKAKVAQPEPAVDRDLYSGMMRLHVLRHATKGPIFGLGMVEKLARRGYRISPGTLYPLLYGLEKKGYLRSTELRNGKSLPQGVSCHSSRAQSIGGSQR